MDSIFILLDRIYPASLNRPFGQEALDRLSYAEARRIDGIFFACGERPFGRRPLYPDDPVDPVQLLFKDKNPFLKYSITGFKGD
jgi:hypothetical protein